MKTPLAHRQPPTAVIADRIPVGVWCRQDSCQFWDRHGIRWGNTFRSSGSLLLLVDDQRADDVADPDLVAGMLAAVDGLSATGLRAVSVTLPDNEPGGIRIRTSAGYDLYMDALGDVSDQLSTLAVFVADRAHDPAFKPQYLDTRTPGRIYYK